MKFEPDDPRLTAYALGELSADEQREIEAHLLEDPAARQYIDEIRSTSDLLSAELCAESAPRLLPSQRKAIHASAGGEVRAPRTSHFPWRPLVAAAAALLVLSVTMYWTQYERPPYTVMKSIGYVAEANAAKSMAAGEKTSEPLDAVGYSPQPSGTGGGWGGGEGRSTATFANSSAPVPTLDDDARERAMLMSRRVRQGLTVSEVQRLEELKEKSAAAKKTLDVSGDSFEVVNVDTPDTQSRFGNIESERKSTVNARPMQPVVPVIVQEPKQKQLDAPKTEMTKAEPGERRMHVSDQVVPAPVQIEVKPETAPVTPLKEIDEFKKPLKTPDNPVNTPAIVDKQVESKFGPTPHTQSELGKTIFLQDKHPAGRTQETPPPADTVSVVTAAQPLDPLGYAKPQPPAEKLPPLRYAPPQYRSYIVPQPATQVGSEEYAQIHDNAFRDTSVVEQRLSTFSADVDTAAYANVRRFLNEGQLPPADAVRIEEMVNYFKYDYRAPSDGRPFHVFMELAQCPWNPSHKLARIGVKAVEIGKNQRPASNLVFLVDVSGSMDGSKKLPLVKKGLIDLVNTLGDNDRVSIVTYSNNINVPLRSTPCNQKKKILGVIESLTAAGSTNGGGGIQSAYAQAAENFIRGGVNRVILATDGDFNVGITDEKQLTELIEAKAKEGVFLSVLGYGMGNLKDAKLELLADKGNGHYAYIDTEAESRRVLVEQLSGTLVTVAKDMKFQVEFNPARVRGYRLIGYENRVLEHADFNNDAKDAGDVGAGHTVTALYEIVPTRTSQALPGTDPLRYQPPEAGAVDSEEILMLKIRYKLHHQDTSNLLEFPVRDNATTYAKASSDFKFAAAVAGFGMLLRSSPYRGNSTFEGVLELAGEAVNDMPERREFIELVRKARELRR